MADINVAISALPRDENYVPLQGTFRTIASGNGTVASANVAVQVKSSPTQAKVIDILNPTSNPDVIVIGDSSVTVSPLNGIPIEPGFTYRLQVTDLSKLWITGGSNTMPFTYNYFN